MARRAERDTDWGADLYRSGLFDVGERIAIPWMREATTDQWLQDDRSKSYIAALSDPHRTSLLATIEKVITDRFPSGQMLVPYVTSLWIARKK